MADKAKDGIAAQARHEAAVLLGVNIENPSAADSLRIDMVSALRLVIDHEQGNILSGKAADLGRLNVAVASLVALLPGQALPETATTHDDPREHMWKTYLESRRRITSEPALSIAATYHPADLIRKHNALPEVAAFLRGLREDEWHHLGE